MARIEYADILGAKFKSNGTSLETGVDCAWVVEEMYRRARLELPRFARADKVEDGDIERFLERNRQLFHRVGDSPGAADKLLDIVVSDPELRGIATHVSVIVSTAPHGWLALTAMLKPGVVAVRPWSITGSIGVYRMRG